MCYFLQTVDYIHSFILLNLSLYILLNFILKSNSVKLDNNLYHRLKTSTMKWTLRPKAECRLSETLITHYIHF